MLRLAVTAGCVLFASTALGQFSSSGGQTNGAFGARSIGQGTTSGTSGFSSGSTSGMGNSSAMGGMNSGAGSAGGNNQIGGAPSQNFKLGSSLSSAQQRSTAGFIGADNADANANGGNVRSMQAMQQQQMTSLFGPQGAFSQMARQNQQRNQNQNQNQGQNGKKQLRIPIKADITLTTAATTSSSLGRQFETRLKKLPGLEKADSVKVTMEGRTAVLTGTVASERDQKLIAGLAMLEPGISAVRNELVVAAAGATAEELPAPAH